MNTPRARIEYVRSLVLDYQPVTRNTIRSDLEKYYRKRRAALGKELENGIFNVAFTSDVWSGRARKDYISVVIHYIDNDWVLNKRIIGFRLLDVRHTGVDIAQCIVNMLEDYTLQNRVIAFTMDNASANDRAIDILRPLVSGHYDSLLHQIYACHIINLIVKAGLKEIEDQIHRLRYAISYLKSSNVR